MEEFAHVASGYKVPRLYRVPVQTIVGYYDPDATRRLTSYIFPALYGAYGFVYADGGEAASRSECNLLVETIDGEQRWFELSTNVNSLGMNKFHVNIETAARAIGAVVTCQNEVLATRSLDEPQDPLLTYTVNGAPFEITEVDCGGHTAAYCGACPQ